MYYFDQLTDTLYFKDPDETEFVAVGVYPGSTEEEAVQLYEESYG